MPDNAVTEGSDANDQLITPSGGIDQDGDIGTTEALFGNEGDEGEEFVPSQIIETDESEGTEETGGDDEGTPKPFYTPEEMRELSEDQIDTSRIPPEMLPFYKALQGNFTRKHQALAEAIKQVKATPVDAPPQAPPQNLDEAFHRDPQGVLTEIDKTIGALARTATEKLDSEPMTALKAQNQVIRLQTLKDGYLRQLQQAQMHFHAVEAVRGEYLNDLSKIPDYDTKQTALAEFAVNELGFDPNELAMLVNPQYTGRMAGKMVHFINNAYDKVHGTSNSADNKQVKKTPNPLLSPKGITRLPSKDTSMSKLIRQAKETGDWTKVILAKGY